MVFITFVLLALGACKKSYNCTCLSTCHADTVQVTYQFKAKTKDASEVCAAYADYTKGCMSNCQLK